MRRRARPKLFCVKPRLPVEEPKQIVVQDEHKEPESFLERVANQRILVVGNGPSALRCAKMMEEFDVVVRFNKFAIREGTGARTDVWACCLLPDVIDHIVSNVENIKPKVVFLVQHDKSDDWLSKCIDRVKKTGIRLCISCRDEWERMVQELDGGPPTTGAMVVNKLIETGAKPTLIGFDQVCGNLKSYFRQEDMYWRHVPFIESTWLIKQRNHGYLNIEGLITEKEEDEKYSSCYAHGYGHGPIFELFSFGKKINAFDHVRTIFDAGCGTGEAMLMLRSNGFYVSGIDISSLAVDKASSSGLEVIHGSLTQIPSCHFDLVWCCDVLEHLPMIWLNEALIKIKGVSKRCLFSISTRKSMFRKNLHLTVRSPGWWSELLSSYFSIRQYETTKDSIKIFTA